MEHAPLNNSRRGIRLLLCLTALCLLGYCAEIFLMGAPGFGKHSDRIYYHDKDPVPFWTQFSLFAAAGIAAAYFTIDWKKGLPLIEALEKRDRIALAMLGPKYVQEVNRKRKIVAVAYILGGALIFALLAGLLLSP